MTLKYPDMIEPMAASPVTSCFDANRARGEIRLSVENNGGVTRRGRVHESGCLRVRFPGEPAGGLEAVLLNTAGGIAGGDFLSVDVSVGPAARLVVSNASAEKVYRSHGPRATIQLKIAVASGGALTWLPQETILFNGAALFRRIEVDLADTARLLLIEPLVFGRTGMDEVVRHGEISDRWRIRRAGRLIYAEGVWLNGAISELLHEPAVTNGSVAIATAFIAPSDPSLAETVHAQSREFRGEVGASCWNGHAILRFCAPDGAALRHDIACALKTLHAKPLPRLWIN